MRKRLRNWLAIVPLSSAALSGGCIDAVSDGIAKGVASGIAGVIEFVIVDAIDNSDGD